jgi:SAM-dependent methyltransferase
MKFSLHVSLPCTVSEAFDALHNPEVFRAVSKPFLGFEALQPSEFPVRYESGKSYVVRVKALGVLSLGTQEINPVTGSEGMARTFCDNGRGLTGALAQVTRFRHTMTLRPSGVGPTILEDELDFDAGVLTPFMGLGFRVFWWWRHRMMKRLAPGWQGETTRMWESRYGSAMWSGRVNETLSTALASIQPGTALDVGCGEGADALWLAEHGFEVTAVDASPKALARGESERASRVANDGRSRAVRWVAADVVRDPLPTPPDQYDLVTAHFVHIPRADREVLWKKLVGAVSRGGTLLIVGHAAEDLDTGLGRPPADLMFDSAELMAALPPSWSTREVTMYQREQTTPEGKTVVARDIVARGSR